MVASKEYQPFYQERKKNGLEQYFSNSVLWSRRISDLHINVDEDEEEDLCLLGEESQRVSISEHRWLNHKEKLLQTQESLGALDTFPCSRALQLTLPSLSRTSASSTFKDL